MSLLVAGLGTWILLHALPIRFRSIRAALIARLGPLPYKGLFSLGMLGSIVMIVFGWQETGFVPVYDTPAWSVHVAMLVIALSIIVGGGHAGNMKRIIRHPQLYCVALWSIGHLMVNGDLRSITLFGGMLAWALVSVILINRRDGEWVKPDPQPWTRDVLTLVLGIIVSAVIVLWLHEPMTGVDPRALLTAMSS